MLKSILVITNLMIGLGCLCQTVSESSDSSITVNDAISFLKKIFSNEKGNAILEARTGNNIMISENIAQIHSIDLTPDSILTVEASYIWKRNNPYNGKITTTNSNTSFRINLSKVALVTYTELEKPQPKTSTSEYSKTETVITYKIYYEDQYGISANTKDAITRNSDNKLESIEGFNFSMYLALENRSRKEFNDLATRISNAFNFLIKFYGGGKPAAEKQSDEKF